MSLMDVVRALRNFYAVFLVILLATAGASYFVWTQVPLTYQSTASLVILPPSQGSLGSDSASFPVNPYQAAGDLSTQVAADALASISSSPEFQERLADSGATSETTSEVSLVGGGVILSLTATNPRPDAAVADLSILADLISGELRDRQLAAGAPVESLLTADVLTVPSDATPMATDRNQVTIAVAAIGAIIALGAVILLEILHRPRRLAPVAPEQPGEEAAEFFRQLAASGAVVAEPQIVAAPLLDAIDRALALAESSPGPEPQPERDDVAPDALPLPFLDDPVEQPVTAGWSLSGDSPVEGSDLAGSDSAAAGEPEVESVTRWSSPDEERHPVPAAPSSPSAG